MGASPAPQPESPNRPRLHEAREQREAEDTETDVDGHLDTPRDYSPHMIHGFPECGRGGLP